MGRQRLEWAMCFIGTQASSSDSLTRLVTREVERTSWVRDILGTRDKLGTRDRLETRGNTWN